MEVKCWPEWATQRRLWVLLTGVVSLLRPVQARAQWTVFDPTNYAENIAHYLKAIEQVKLAQSQIANQVTALRKLSNPQFRDVTGAWSGVNGAMASGSGILYGQPGASAVLQTSYPGEVTNRQYVPERTAQVARTLATAAAILRASQAQATTFGPGRQQLDAMRGQVAGIHGHEEALELQNTVSVFGANEAMLTRQAVEAQGNLQAVYVSHMVNADAQAEANARQAYASMASRGTIRRPLLTLRPPA